MPQELSKVLFGLILEASQEYNWEAFGTITPSECAAVFGDILDTAQLCEDGSNDNMPIGSVIAVALTTMPAGYLLCDGAEYDEVDYPDLYAIIASQFKGSGVFNVPDLRGRTVYGAGDLFPSDSVPFASSGGLSVITLTDAEMPMHSHTKNSIGNDEYSLQVESSPSFLARQTWANNPSGAYTRLSTSTGLTGQGFPHGNMPPYVGLNYAIKAENL